MVDHLGMGGVAVDHEVAVRRVGVKRQVAAALTAPATPGI
jgi:hypothetical protein